MPEEMKRMDGSVIFVSCLLLSVFGSMVDVKSQLYETELDFDNKLSSNSLLYQNLIDSLITCSMMCFMRGSVCGCHSFNSLQKICRLHEYCCHSKTTINDVSWKYYKSHHDIKCPNEYTKMTNIGVGVCLKFVTTPTGYLNAAIFCQQIGGNLIRLDSHEKFDIFQQFINCNKNADEDFGVWVQAIRSTNHVWRFEDESEFSEVCPLALSGNNHETRLRFSTAQRSCSDTLERLEYRYVCEYV
ncbi:uncharacterized protein LOC130049548 [Ostrea edulis]|uniref:uncharacterized protein LOC130049548 n=1 Tax=Ostrea edulis TaxID=37623 RepID=UPI0024AF6A69|nr:uncharacterized protein LOC130049548 [Ostrea edulis]